MSDSKDWATAVRTTGRRVLRRARRMAGSVTGSAPGPAKPATATAAKQTPSELRAESARAWRAGDRKGALDQLRRAARRHTRNPATWHTYAMRLHQAGRSDAAVEAAANALDLEPTRLATLELMLSAVEDVDSPLVRAAYADALDQLVDRLAPESELLDEAAAFILAARHRRGLKLLARSGNPAVQAAVQLLQIPREEWHAIGDDAGTESLAQAHVLLAKGGFAQGARVLQSLPTHELPLTAIRIAIVRSFRREKWSGIRALVTQYQRARPDDGWAIEQLRRAYRLDVGRMSLVEDGITLPPAVSTPWSATPRRVFYQLHNSLPYDSGGYATRTHGLLSAIKRSGWDIQGVTRLGYPFDMGKNVEIGIPDHDVVDDVVYRRLSTGPGEYSRADIELFLQRYADALQPLVERERPAILHAASNSWNGLAAAIVGRRLNIPTVYEVRGLWEITRMSREPIWANSYRFRLMARLEAQAASEATRVIAITAALKQEMIDRGVDADKIELVPNGVDANRFTPTERDVDLARRLGVEGKTVIGYVGSVVDYEGLDLLVEAAARLSRERSDFVVLIVGDGSVLLNLQAQVQSLGVGDTVRFVGRVPHEEVERYYSIIDVCPLPRHPLPVCEMVSPLKPFESMAMGKVVLASDVAALAEIVEDGVNGMLHRKGDVESLTDKLRILIDDPALRSRISTTARDWVVENRQWDVLARRVVDIYSGITG